jgi:hypothetical protein
MLEGHHTIAQPKQEEAHLRARHRQDVGGDKVCNDSDRVNFQPFAATAGAIVLCALFACCLLTYSACRCCVCASKCIDRALLDSASAQGAGLMFA